MRPIEIITLLREAIDASCKSNSDCAWRAATQKMGLQHMGGSGGGSVDEYFTRPCAGFQIHLHHECADTSIVPSSGADITTLTLKATCAGYALYQYSNIFVV